MRSIYLVDFRKELAELNNHLSHYIFVWEQFYIDNSSAIDSRSEEFTTDIYPSNPSSEQFNVKLKLLNSSHLDTYNFILKSLFLLIYTQFESYIRSFYEFTRKADNSLPSLNFYDSVPDKVFENLGMDISDILNQKEEWTLSYIRFRRNRITHTAGESKGDLADLIKQKGNSLQAFWTKTLKNGLFGIDFQSEDISSFKKEEIFDLINIWRLLVDKIDASICNRLGEPSITASLGTKFTKKNEIQIPMWGSIRAERKFRAYCKHEFDIDL